jgi:hypothetical protein
MYRGGESIAYLDICSRSNLWRATPRGGHDDRICSKSRFRRVAKGDSGAIVLVGGWWVVGSGIAESIVGNAKRNAES